MNDEYFDELYMISDRLRCISFLRDAAIEFTFAEYSDFRRLICTAPCSIYIRRIFRKRLLFLIWSTG